MIVIGFSIAASVAPSRARYRPPPGLSPGRRRALSERQRRGARPAIQHAHNSPAASLGRPPSRSEARKTAHMRAPFLAHLLLDRKAALRRRGMGALRRRVLAAAKAGHVLAHRLAAKAAPSRKEAEQAILFHRRILLRRS